MGMEQKRSLRIFVLTLLMKGVKMKTTKNTVNYPDLNGSEQHLPLKNRKGEKGDKTHVKSDEKLDAEAAKAIDASDAETQIADELRDLTNKS